jgi:hypothetical protein
MKSSIFMVAMLFILSMTACTASENDPMEQTETLSSLTSSYGARSLAATNNICKKLHLEDLPGVSVEEACNILSRIKLHKESEKHYDVQENLHGSHFDVDIIMDETIGHQYRFTIQLHMQRDQKTNVTYYKSYEAGCNAHEFTWYINGFSFATDNTTGDNKFEAPSSLYFKILGEDVEYIQIPVTIKGTYCPINNKADFTYIL